jgi:hypothetical protein
MEEDNIKTFYFPITLVGSGDNLEEAWQDAIDGFVLEPSIPPEKYYTDDE